MAEPKALSNLRKSEQSDRLRAEIKKPRLDEQSLLKEAQAAGLKGKELAAFMAQMAHESGNFRYAEELGGGKDYYSGGKRYKGRGYIQITHDYNYKKYGDRLGVDLVNNPEMAAQPDIAAKIALEYWKDNVRPRVKNWDNVFEHSRAINLPSAKTEKQVKGMADRKAKYAKYSQQYATPEPPPPAPTVMPTPLAPQDESQTRSAPPGPARPATPETAPAVSPTPSMTPAPGAASEDWEQYAQPEPTPSAPAQPEPTPKAPAQPEFRRVQINGQSGEIPLDKLEKFLQDNPGATVLD